MHIWEYFMVMYVRRVRRSVLCMEKNKKMLKNRGCVLHSGATYNPKNTVNVILFENQDVIQS